MKTLTRAKFEELNMDLFRKTMKPVEQVLKDAGVKKDEIDDVSEVQYIIPATAELNFVFTGRPCRWFHSYPQDSTTPQGVLQRQGAF